MSAADHKSGTLVQVPGAHTPNVDYIEPPVEIAEYEVIAVCDHTPRLNWVHFARGEAVLSCSDGRVVDLDHLGLCNDCHALPIEEVKVHLARRLREVQA